MTEKKSKRRPVLLSKDLSENVTMEIVPCKSTYSICYNNKLISARVKNANYKNQKGPVYKQVYFSVKGNAQMLCDKLNEEFDSVGFTVVTLGITGTK